MAKRRRPTRPRLHDSLELPSDNTAYEGGAHDEDIDIDGLDHDRDRDAVSEEGDASGDPTEKKEDERKRKIHELAMKRFKTAEEELRAQRDRERIDQRFVQNIDLADQWPEAVLRARGAIENEDGDVPYRPCVTINELAIPCQQVVNEARQSRFGVKIAPNGKRAKKQEAWLRQGLYRGIEKASNAHEARLWALQRAVEAGVGYWRVDRVWSNDGDFNQDIVICEIPNQQTVFPDPFSMKPNLEDMEYAFIIDDLPIEEYEREFGTSQLAGLTDDSLGDMTEHARAWITASTRRVAEYFYAEHKTRKLLYLEQMGAVFEDQLPKDFPRNEKGKIVLPPGTKTRSVDRRYVQWCFINAVEILEERPWGGRYIPIVRTYGQRHNVDGQWVFKGMVADAKDPQRVNNYMTSAQIEMIGLGTKAPYTVDPQQIVGLEKWWDNANTVNYAYLPVHTVIEGPNGESINLGYPKRNLEEPPIQAITLAIREAKANIKATTGRHGPSLGEASPERSGRAIRERKVQGELTTSHFLDVLANVAIPYEAMIVNDLLFEVYDEPGRNALLVGDTDADEQEVLLNQPFVPGQNGAPPEAVDPQNPPPPGVEVQTYTLDKDGEYLVTCTVGKSTQTQKEENALIFSEIAESAPNLIPQIADLWVGSLEGPAAEEAARRLKEGAQVPPEIQQQLQELQAANQELQGMVQEFEQKEMANQAKLQADIFIKRHEIASRERIAQEQIRSQFAQLRAKLSSADELAALDREYEKFEAEAQRRHDIAITVLEAELKALLATQQAANAERMASRQAHDADRMDSKQGARQERLALRKSRDDERKQLTKGSIDRALVAAKGSTALAAARMKQSTKPSTARG